MRRNNFGLMQSYKVVSVGFMKNTAFLYSAGSNEITMVFQPAVDDLQRLHSTLLGGLVRAELVHHNLFSIPEKSKLTPYSVAVVHPPPCSCSLFNPSRPVVLVMICSALSSELWVEGNTGLCALCCQNQGFLSGLCPAFDGTKVRGSFLKFLAYSLEFTLSAALETKL